MKKRRAGVTIVGILMLIYGILVLTGSKAILSSLLIGLNFLVCGVYILKLKNWARILAIISSEIMFLYFGLISFAFLASALRALSLSGFSFIYGEIEKAIAISYLIFWIPPLVFIVILLLPRVKKQFLAEKATRINDVQLLFLGVIIAIGVIFFSALSRIDAKISHISWTGQDHKCDVSFRVTNVKNEGIIVAINISAFQGSPSPSSNRIGGGFVELGLQPKESKTITKEIYVRSFPIDHVSVELARTEHKVIYISNVSWIKQGDQYNVSFRASNNSEKALTARLNIVAKSKDFMILTTKTIEVKLLPSESKDIQEQVFVPLPSLNGFSESFVRDVNPFLLRKSVQDNRKDNKAVLQKLGFTTETIKTVSEDDLIRALINNVLTARDFHSSIESDTYYSYLDKEIQQILLRAQSNDTTLTDLDYIQLNRSLFNMVCPWVIRDISLDRFEVRVIRPGDFTDKIK